MKTEKTKRIVVVLLTVLALCGSVWANQIHVPGQYPTIQAAINAAVNDDVVIIADGTYTGAGNKNIDFEGKAITVRSENGPKTCIIDCENNGRGFYFNNGESENSVLDGFTITKGYIDNSSPGGNRGGGIYCRSSSPTITNCIFMHNTVDDTESHGGGIDLTESSASISKCMFIDNWAVGSSSDGGAMIINGGAPKITNCLLTDNTCLNPGGGAGARINTSSALFLNCTITNNSAGWESALSIKVGSSLNFINCIIWNNPGSTYSPIRIEDSLVTFANCDIEGGWNGPGVHVQGSGTVTDGGGNIDSDPCFIDAVNPNLYARDYRLSNGSPCINTGNNAAVPVQVTTDLAGNPRIIDGIVDIGAYEAESDSPIAHWKFDEGAGSVAYDSAENNDGTIYGAGWTTGIIDGALDFDGVDDYVDIPHNEDFKFSGGFTLSTWAKPVLVDDRGRLIICEDNPVTDGYYLTESLDGDGEWHFCVFVGGTYALVRSDYPPNGGWQHIVGVRESDGVLKMYVDGVVQTDMLLKSGAIDDLSANLKLGTNEIASTAFFNGLMDDVRIYDRALSAVEVEELYNSVPPVGDTYHVDGVNGSDLNDGLTKETAFATIQKGINSSDDGDMVLVWPGVYNEAATQGINFKGKAITLKSAADAAVLEVPGFTAVTFAQGEDGNSILSNFVVRGSSTGILTLFANPTISNVTIVDNDNGVIADNADPEITNCIFWNNFNGDLFGSPDPIETRYSWFEDDVNEPNMPAAGLISHWKFDEGGGLIAYDSAGNNDAVVFGAMWTTSPFGNALDFDGVDDYVIVADEDSLDITDNITISSWVRPFVELNNQFIVAKWQDSEIDSSYGYRLEYSNLKFFLAKDNTKTSKAFSDLLVVTNTWNHVVVTWDGNLVRGYLNGIASSETESFAGPINVTNEPLEIGYNPGHGGGAGGAYFDGIIDEVAIYNRALSAGEIEQIYEPVPNPLFVNAAGGDYHLKSERGRYWPAHDVWVLDDETSPCIDGGDPGIGLMNESMPNGGRINMGAYGNTAYASMSECRGKADINCDGIVNFKDLAFLAQFWLEE